MPIRLVAKGSVTHLRQLLDCGNGIFAVTAFAAHESGDCADSIAAVQKLAQMADSVQISDWQASEQAW